LRRRARMYQAAELCRLNLIRQRTPCPPSVTPIVQDEVRRRGALRLSRRRSNPATAPKRGNSVSYIAFQMPNRGLEPRVIRSLFVMRLRRIHEMPDRSLLAIVAYGSLGEGILTRVAGGGELWSWPVSSRARGPFPLAHWMFSRARPLFSAILAISLTGAEVKARVGGREDLDRVPGLAQLVRFVGEHESASEISERHCQRPLRGLSAVEYKAARRLRKVRASPSPRRNPHSGYWY
jgi:hypothetical protein